MWCKTKETYSPNTTGEELRGEAIGPQDLEARPQGKLDLYLSHGGQALAPRIGVVSYHDLGKGISPWTPWILGLRAKYVDTSGFGVKNLDPEGSQVQFSGVQRNHRGNMQSLGRLEPPLDAAVGQRSSAEILCSSRLGSHRICVKRLMHPCFLSQIGETQARGNAARTHALIASTSKTQKMYDT